MKVNDLWCAVWHPKGSYHVMQMRELIATNRLRCLQGKNPYGIIGYGATLEQADEVKRQIAKEKHDSQT